MMETGKYSVTFGVVLSCLVPVWHTKDGNQSTVMTVVVVVVVVDPCGIVMNKFPNNSKLQLVSLGSTHDACTNDGCVGIL